MNAPLDKQWHATGAIVNVPAMLIVAVMSWICYIGMKKSSGANSFMVYLKVGVIVVFVLAGLQFVDTANWHPYIPENTGERGHFGWSGIMQGAAIIFFSYIGFDTASTTALEIAQSSARRAARDSRRTRHLVHPVHRDVSRADWHGALREAGR